METSIFHLNVRDTQKGEWAGSHTVHLDGSGCQHSWKRSGNPLWQTFFGVKTMQNAHPKKELGPCKICWPGQVDQDRMHATFNNPSST